MADLNSYELDKIAQITHKLEESLTKCEHILFRLEVGIVIYSIILLVFIVLSLSFCLNK